MIWWELLALLLLMVLNGVFAMSELAMFSARRARLQQRADTGDRRAAAALALMATPGRLLSTVQIGITLVGVLTGAYGGATLAERLGRWLEGVPALAEHAHSIAIAVTVVAVTYLSLIIGELVPKRIALARAEGVAAAMARPMAMLARLASPVVWLLHVSSEGLLRILGLHGTPEQLVTEEEVRAMIAQGTESGVFVQAEKEMIEGVLRLADRTVGMIMTPRPDIVWIDADADAPTVTRVVRESGHSRFPVRGGEDEALVGVVESRDLAIQMLTGGSVDIRAAVRATLAVPEGTPVLRLLEQFKRTPFHFAVVVDEYGGVEGVVTAADILEGIAGELPQIGEPDAPEAVQREDGSWLVDGLMPLDEFADLIGEKEITEDADYHTAAGFVLDRFGHVPETGESIEWNGIRFEVVDMDGRRIDKILVIPPGDAMVG